MRHAVVPTLLLAVLACESFTPDDGAPSAPADAGSDGASPLDATAGKDGEGADAGSGRLFCDDQPKATLCLDFEPRDASVFSSWTREEALGSLTVSEGTLHSVIDSTIDVDGGRARLRYGIPVQAVRTRLSFRAKILPVEVGQAQQFTLAEFLCTNGGSYSGVLVNVRKGPVVGPSTLLKAPAFDDVKSPLPTDQWLSFVLDAQWHGASPVARLRMNNEPLGEVPLTACPEGAQLEVLLGLGSATQQGAEAFFDDVVYELNPT